MEKSYNDLQRQFKRIWYACIEASTPYVNSDVKDDTVRFQRADHDIRSSKDPRDIQLNDRITLADRICTRYLENIRKLGGYSDTTPYYARGERLQEYLIWCDKKYNLLERTKI